MKALAMTHPILSLCIPIASLAIAIDGCGGGGGGRDDDADTGAPDTAGDTAVDQDGDGAADTPADDGSEATIECTVDGDCDDGDPCTTDTCDDLDEVCVNESLDADGDGYAAATGPGGEACGGTDCDDASDTVYPSAAEDACDLVDSDCNLSNAEYIDDDRDGWIDHVCASMTAPVPGYDGVGDCNDDAADAYPGAEEGCDGIFDNDCDGDATEVDTDTDGDGFSPASCGGLDCDDTDPDTYPGAPEICDDVDQDCDADVRDAPGADDDSDTVLDAACYGGTDCDDTAAAIRPGATEACDAVDDDCDGLWSDGGADDDLDGYLDQACGGDDCNDLDLNTNPGAAEGGCDIIDNDCDGDSVDGPMDSDGDDFVDLSCTDGDDCDDDDPLSYPGATDGCDDVDQDCDGSWADGGADDDGDTVLDSACGGTDCDDTLASVRPGSAESGCDSTDNDCDGDALDGVADDDDDDYLDSACAGGTDCNDLSAAVHPGAAEACDTIDQDCDGTWSDGGADDDLDGHLDSACGGDDCNDLAGTVYAGATEICWNGVDEDCDGLSTSPGPRIAPVRVTDVTSGGQGYSDIIWTGSEFGAAWYDMRDGWPQIYFARISAAGVVQGANTRVSNTTTDSMLPSLDWTGSEWWIGWYEAATPTPAALMARLSAFGAKIGTDIVVSDTAYSSYAPSLAWSGSVMGVAWYARPAVNNRIFFNRFSITGAKLGSDLALDSSSASAWEPSLVWTGSEYAVGFTDTRAGNQEIYFLRVSAAGAKVGADVRVTNSTGTSNSPTLAWSGAGYAVAWADGRDGNEEIYFATLSPTGGSTLGETRLTATTSAVSWFPRVDWADGSWALGWYDLTTPGMTALFNYVSSSGTKVGTDMDVDGSGCGNGGYPISVASTATEVGVLWSDICSGTGGLYFTLIPRCD